MVIKHNLKKNDNMKITEIEIYKFDIPFKNHLRVSFGKITHARNILIRILSNNGLTGIGEASPVPFITGETQESDFALAQTIAELLKGKNPLAIEERNRDIDNVITGNPTIKSAFDMALYDIVGKAFDIPVYTLLGGNNDHPIYTDKTVGINTPEKMTEESAKAVKEGFMAIKVKLGTTFSEDLERIKAIRESIGNELPLRIDANQGWDYRTAVKTLQALEPYNIQHCEEPIAHWNIRDLAMVRKLSPIPIMADESLKNHRDAFILAEMKAVDLFNIKLAKCGGIHPALKIVAVAEAAGIKCQVGCMLETRLASTALCHFASSSGTIEFYDIDSHFLHSKDPVIGGITFEKSRCWKLSDGFGLGVDIDDSFLQDTEMITI